MRVTTLRILIIGKAGTVTFRLGRELRESGYTVDSAGDDAEALFVATCRPPDAIVLVDTDADLSALALCTALTDLCPHATVTYLTPSADPNVRVGALDAGATDCVSMPYNVHELRARLRARLRAIESATVARCDAPRGGPGSPRQVGVTSCRSH